MHCIWLSCHLNFLSWNSSLYFIFMNFITLNILGQLFCSLNLNWIYLKWSHDEFRLCIFDRLVTEVMLHSSDYILSGGAIFQSVLLQMVFTLIIWLGWCLQSFSTVKLLFLSFVINNYFVEKYFESM